jgi:hypothetical protein
MRLGWARVQTGRRRARRSGGLKIVHTGAAAATSMKLRLEQRLRLWQRSGCRVARSRWGEGLEKATRGG